MCYSPSQQYPKKCTLFATRQTNSGHVRHGRGVVQNCENRDKTRHLQKGADHDHVTQPRVNKEPQGDI
jgi:hypothetical protein